jgi:hypothetical protein
MNIEFNNIVRKFKTINAPFLVTGSWAIMLHAEHIGLNPHRAPRDFDFAVTTFEPFINALASMGYKLDEFKFLGPQTRRVTMRKGLYHVDLLRAGGPLAPGIRNVTTIRRIPVASLNGLAEKKKNILNTIENKKARMNLNFLVVLKNFKNNYKWP